MEKLLLYYNSSYQITSLVYNNTDISKLLVELGANLDVETSENFYTPLMICCQKNYLDLTDLIIQTSPETVQKKNILGISALQVAQQAGNEAIVNKLLKYGALIRPKTKGKEK